MKQVARIMNAILSKAKNEEFEFLHEQTRIQFLRDRIFIIDPKHGEYYYSQGDYRAQKYENIIDDIIHGAQELHGTYKKASSKEEGEQFADVLNRVSLPKNFHNYISPKRKREQENNKTGCVEEELKSCKIEGSIDRQWDNTIKLVGMVVKNSKSTEQALAKLRMLCHNPEEFDEFIENKNED